MALAYLGLGSNLGDRPKNLNQAITLLTDEGVEILQKATVIETDPVGGPPQGKYLNTVICVKTDLDPQQLLKRCQNIEQKLGRIRTQEPNSARTIDIDILLYDELKMATPELTIPHPRMHERKFVMLPLNEIRTHACS